MGSVSVFQSLVELFPQVDLRILRAVAIEHSKDISEAIESILCEVLPKTVNSQDVCLSSDGRGETIPLGPNVETDAFPIFETISGAYNGASSPNNTINAVSPRSTCADILETGSIFSTAHGENLERPFDENDGEAMLSKAELLEVELVDGETDPLNLGSFSISNYTNHGANDASRTSNVALYSDIQYLDGELPCDSHPSSSTLDGHDHLASLTGCTRESFSSSSRENPTGHPFIIPSPPSHMLATDVEHQLAVHGNSPDSECLGAMPDDRSNNFSECGQPVSGCSLSTHEFEYSDERKLELLCCADMENEGTNIASECSKPGSSSVELSIFGTNVDDSLIKSLPSTVTSRSGQVIRIDLLEEFVLEAKDYKKALLLAMESVLNKLRDVERQEKEADQAKEEASRSGLDILKEVDDLRKAVHEAKLKNDMHAMEVYGEKSILATEARELQSRLLNLSNERDKSLSIIDEVHQVLQERLTAAQAEKIAAEKLKLEKEEAARKDLDEQVLLMDKVVKEMKNLQEEAEENTKLREFLMDRSSIVDVLQGEIAVIFEDVKLMKQRIDEELPLPRSLSSSRSSLSSSSSLKGRALPDSLNEQSNLPDNLVTCSKEQPLEGDLIMHAEGSEGEASLEDEWILFH